MRKSASNTAPDTNWLRDDVVSAANSVRADFARLVEVLGLQLQAAGTDCATTAAISEAREAAERGLYLSNAFLNALAPSTDHD